MESAFPQATGNISNETSSMNFSPSNLLESLIPGYGPIQKFLLFTFGFDVTVLVSLGAILWLSIRLSRSTWTVLWNWVASFWMSEISITSRDEIHTHIIHFLAHKYTVSSSRRLMAETPSRSTWQLDSEDKDAPQTLVDATGKVKYLNFSNQEAKSTPRFTPAIGSHNFWHNGTYFQLRRKEVSMFSDYSGGPLRDHENVTISCFGRSSLPIKTLIQDAKAHYHQGHRQKTIIKRPAPKEMRRWGGRGAWVKIAERPCRPMNTVVLDDDRKLDVLADINEYLNPATARWYANRGIPYRRGYLFHGPPGTGKTSLTFALAGVFGLDIHVVSLLEPTLTEEDLGMLFTNLPARCIVLLEDIDTAGLIRNEAAADEENVTKGNGEEKDFNVKSLTKALKKANDEDAKKGISLSGLLNVIDGVASHEGRVLVMTTNHPEKLDDALIRDGRVDHQVAFRNATQKQIEELFERMYASDVPDTGMAVSNTTTTPITGSKTAAGNNILEVKKKDSELTPPPTPTNYTSQVSVPDSLTPLEKVQDGKVDAENLSKIALEFSTKIPDDLLSPAEIQGFLLKRKKDPRKALLEVEKWVEVMRETKESGSKVRAV